MLCLAPLGAGGLLNAWGDGFLPTIPSMLTKEDGTNVANANTLVLIADVSAHATEIGNTAWSAATSVAQEQAILRAMRWFRTRESMMKGVRTYSDQVLAYPRTGVWAYGREIKFNEIPVELIQALSEAALLEQATPDALQPTLEGNIKRIRQKVDGVGEKEREYFGSGQIGATSKPKVMKLIAPFLEIGSGEWTAH